jgi:predicted  nucleic acid-binding Zn-ribbon protein
MSAASDSFFQLELDDSLLEQSFKQIEAQIDRHEERILNLRRLLSEKTSRSDLTDLQESVTKTLNCTVTTLDTQMATLESTLKLTMKLTEENIEARFLDMMNVLNSTVKQRISEIESRIPPPGPPPELSVLSNRLGSIEERVFSNGKNIRLVRTCVQQIASSLGVFNGTSPTLDDSLPEVIGNSLKSVNVRIESLCKGIEMLKEKVKTLHIPRKQSEGPLIEQQAHHESTDFDLSSIRPYPLMVATWRDPPDLPNVESFMNVREVVDYIYRFVPKLQAHLAAMHTKLVEQNADIAAKTDKPAVEKLFEKFQTIIRDVHVRMDELASAIEQTASREEVNQIIDEVISLIRPDGQTAVGQVKCMACGRGIAQVVGAVSPQDAHRTLGTPTSSLVFKSGASPVSVMGQAKGGFDPGIVESPRSVRSLRSPPRAPLQLRLEQLED